MRQNETLSPNLTAKQCKVLKRLVAGDTIESAAKNANVSRATVHRWLKDEVFAAEYRDERRALVSQGTATLQASFRLAVATLACIMADSKAPTGARVSAARVVIDSSLRAVELDDLAARIEALESTPKKEPKLNEHHHTQE